MASRNQKAGVFMSVVMSVVYSLYDALVSIKVPDDKAKAVIDAMEREMMDKLATRADLTTLRAGMSGEFIAVTAEFKLVRQEMGAIKDGLSRDIQALEARLAHQMDLLGTKLTITLGGLMVILLGVMATLLRIP
jgi:hypothetical protein